MGGCVSLWLAADDEILRQTAKIVVRIDDVLQPRHYAVRSLDGVLLNGVLWEWRKSVLSPLQWWLNLMAGLPEAVRWLIVAVLSLVLVLLTGHILYSIVQAVRPPRSQAPAEPGQAELGHRSHLAADGHHITAGLGTRFAAWLIDNIILAFLMIVAWFLLLIFVAIFGSLPADMLDNLTAWMNSTAHRAPNTVVMYFAGIGLLILGLASFLYFSASELFLRGQTLGKRACKIRVVKANGLALDAGSIILRNLFRVADNIPLLWIVPVVSQRSQRFGDLLAGTIVVSDQAEEPSSVRQQLAERPAAEARYRFDHATLGRLRPGDIEAAERTLERWATLSSDQQQEIVGRLLTALCARMQIEPPPAADRQVFLEDLLAAEFRRQDRQLR